MNNKYEVLSATTIRYFDEQACSGVDSLFFSSEERSLDFETCSGVQICTGRTFRRATNSTADRPRCRLTDNSITYAMGDTNLKLVIIRQVWIQAFPHR